MSLINKLTFTCTDRLNETKNLEKDLNNNENNDKKVSNQNLIDKLNEFQSEVNQLMTDFVNKEKEAVEAKILTKNQSNLKENTDQEEEEEEEESEEEDSQKENDSVGERASKRDSNENKTTESDEPIDKKKCL
jgi:hypothetical protein